MGLRPAEAIWFELLVPRADLTRALAALAQTGQVELQTDGQPDQVFELPGLSAAVAEFHELERRYGPWWPEGRIPSLTEALEPVAAMQSALQALQQWAAAVDPLIEQAEQVDIEAQELAELADLMAGDLPPLPDFALLAAAGPMLSARLYRLPERLPEEPGAEIWPASMLSVALQGRGGQEYLLTVGPAEVLSRLDERMLAVKARRLAIPAWLPMQPAAASQAIAERLATAQSRGRALRAAIDDLSMRHGLDSALGVMALMQWFAGHAPALPVTEHFVLISGWCSQPDGRCLDEVLNETRVEHVLRLRPAPRGLARPIILHNPRWVRPFELFPKLLGTPGANEVDPSRILAVVTPVMFGFMFGDVGQGAVLLALGLWLRRRAAVFGLLVPFGAMAMLFGVLFGSVFANEHLIAPLWLHPLDQPAIIMGIALAFGVGVIALGLAFDGLRALWGHSGLHWLLTRAGLVLAYFGILAAFLHPEWLHLVWLGCVWFLVGSAVVAEHGRLAAMPRALGELIEGLLQLLVNTISFVRVGAFALAHAGLSAAVFGLAEAAGWGVAGLIVIILGNALVIALEGLIVGIQTTRLMLFEFFIRFLSAEGRPFKPLTGPGTVFRSSGRGST